MTYNVFGIKPCSTLHCRVPVIHSLATENISRLAIFYILLLITIFSAVLTHHWTSKWYLLFRTFEKIQHQNHLLLCQKCRHIHQIH